MAEYHLHSPLSEQEIRRLRIGDTVYLSGSAFTCRSRLHRYIFDEGHTLPFAPEEGSILIHNGPIVVRENGRWKLMSFMPTSSIRFEKWGARSVREWNLRLICGKTTMGAQTMQAMCECGCVHVSPQSVSPLLWIDSIGIRGVDLLEQLGSIEAAWHFELNELGPFVVDMDTSGQNLFDQMDAEVLRREKEALKKMGVAEDFTYTRLYGRPGKQDAESV